MSLPTPSTNQNNDPSIARALGTINLVLALRRIQRKLTYHRRNLHTLNHIADAIEKELQRRAVRAERSVSGSEP